METLKSHRSFLIFILFLLFVVFLSPAPSSAAPYYQGQVLRIVVGHESGGGYDRLARLLAKHLPRHIPGKPTVLVENMPGAGSIVAANYLYNVAKPDGLTIATVDRGLPIAQLLKAEGVKYELLKYAWIGSAAVESTILTIRSDFALKTIDALRKAKEPVHLGSVGPSSNDYQFPSLLNAFAGFNFKFVTYVSGPTTYLAIERKEVDGKAGSYNGLKPLIDRGVVTPILRCGISLPGIENLPVDEDLAGDKMGKTIMAMRSAPDRVGRPFMAPPGTPAETITILRDAFAKAIKDPELLADANKGRLDVEYVPADECIKILDHFFSQPEQTIKEFAKYIKF